MSRTCSRGSCDWEQSLRVQACACGDFPSVLVEAGLEPVGRRVIPGMGKTATACSSGEFRDACYRTWIARPRGLASPDMSLYVKFASWLVNGTENRCAGIGEDRTSGRTTCRCHCSWRALQASASGLRRRLGVGYGWGLPLCARQSAFIGSSGVSAPGSGWELTGSWYAKVAAGVNGFRGPRSSDSGSSGRSTREGT